MRKIFNIVFSFFFKGILGHEQGTELIVDQIRVYLAKKDWESAKFMIEHNQIDIFDLEFDLQGAGKCSLLHAGIILDNFEAVKYAVEKGVSPNYLSLDPFITPLSLATIFDRSHMAKFLFDSGAIAWKKDALGNVPIFYAAAKNNLEIFDLIFRSSDLTYRNRYGISPLMIMIYAALDGNPEMKTRIKKALNDNFVTEEQFVEAVADTDKMRKEEKKQNKKRKKPVKKHII